MSTNLCEICETEDYQYKCPRCFVAFCSVDCYQSRKHYQCSDWFLRDNLIEGIRVANGDSKKNERQIIGILKRTQPQESSEADIKWSSDNETDSDDETSLENRLKNIDLNESDEVWKRLTESEKEEFQCLIKTGDIEKLIPPVQLWWDSYPKRFLVTELCSDYNIMYPKLWKKIPRFADISKTNPQPFIKWNIVNVLASYLFTVRYFHGDHNHQIRSSLSMIFGLSAVLQKNAVFSTLSDAVKSVIQESWNYDSIKYSSANEDYLSHDVKNILDNKLDKKMITMLALSDICSMIQTALRTPDDKTFFLMYSQMEYCPSVISRSNGEIASKTTQPILLRHMKKIEYFLSMLNMYSL